MNHCLLILLLSFISFNSSAQKACKVLLPMDVTTYEGKCKKGLAHGKGKAIGTDRYEGQFKKGYPHGTGTYYWSNSDYYIGEWMEGKRHGIGTMHYESLKPDSMLRGTWDKDVFMGIMLDEPRILQQQNVSRHMFFRAGHGNKLIINILREGRAHNHIMNFSIIGDSGMLTERKLPLVYDGIQFPLRAKIAYSTPSETEEKANEVIIEFVIPKTGIWELTIFN